MATNEGVKDSPAMPKAAPKSKTKTKKKSSETGELDYDRAQPFDPRDVRAMGAPCHGQHLGKNYANQHAAWSTGTRCGLRLQYVPRAGKTGLHRASGPLLQDTQTVITKVPEEKETLEFNPRLRDQAVVGRLPKSAC